MYFTDHGVEEQKKRRGEEEVTFCGDRRRARCGALHCASLKLRWHALKIRCHRTPRLRTLETFLELLLTEVREAIAARERREAERLRGVRDRPVPPDWLLEMGLNRDAPPVQVHVGDCWNAGKRSKGVSRGEARQALAEGVKACDACRPESALGFVDG
ncbi:DUF6104 family protein [Streptomyces sp. NPDC047725]|uniref:DUF6104 family protein n=1 Tax=Streptomyces sp. NPDC047725 TaxID=3365487 RepID=UPI00371443A1